MISYFVTYIYYEYLYFAALFVGVYSRILKFVWPWIFHSRITFVGPRWHSG